MAAEGMKFTNFYSAAEVCTPSRAAILTGPGQLRIAEVPITFRNRMMVMLRCIRLSVVYLLTSMTVAQ